MTLNKNRYVFYLSFSLLVCYFSHFGTWALFSTRGREQDCKQSQCILLHPVLPLSAVLSGKKLKNIELKL